MVCCAVLGCGSNSIRDKVRFFRFPSVRSCGGRYNTLRSRRRLEWIAALKRDDLTEKKLLYERVCARHFISGEPSQLHDIENVDWAPSLNLDRKSKHRRQSKQRFETVKKKIKKGSKESEPTDKDGEEEDQSDSLQGSGGGLSENGSDKSMSTVSVVGDTELDSPLREELIKLREELSSYLLNEEVFQNDLDKCYYYTSLDFNCLTIVFLHLKPFFETSDNSHLDQFQQLILFLMKLRHSFHFADLSYRFNISRTTAKQVFLQVLQNFHTHFRFLVSWQSRDNLKFNEPKCFKESFNNSATVIIDCIEVFYQREEPEDTSWYVRPYKEQMNGAKFLIAFSPRGTIVFISEAYSGQCSVKTVIESCGLLEKLNFNDKVLMSQSFCKKHSLNNCLLNVTPRSKGLKHFDENDTIGIDESSYLKVQRQAEKMHGLLSDKFSILESGLPTSFFKKSGDNIPIVNMIITACCAIVNIETTGSGTGR